MAKLIEGADYFVRVVPFPSGCGCDGSVTPNDDGTFSIYLDSRTNRERQMLAYDHEIKHVVGDDFYNVRNITEIEDI